MGGHIFGHIQGHVTSVFKPYPLPTGRVPSTGGGSGPGGNGGILLETGGFYILLESGDYILLE